MGPYLKLTGMIAASMTLMFAASYVVWSDMTLYRILIMGGLMTFVMLAGMRGMYTDRLKTLALATFAAVMLVAGVWLLRGQGLVQDRSWMQSMIPHHSTAILTSERAGLSDVRVRQLAEDIIEAQEKEIAQMQWLLRDIRENGPAQTPDAAQTRPIPPEL
jgi:hypothetical protein